MHKTTSVCSWLLGEQIRLVVSILELGYERHGSSKSAASVYCKSLIDHSLGCLQEQLRLEIEDDISNGCKLVRSSVNPVDSQCFFELVQHSLAYFDISRVRYNVYDSFPLDSVG